MQTEGVRLTVAFFAGLASFASPCVLPLVPAYLGILAGLDDGQSAGRRVQLTHGLFFVLGFSLLFVLTGAAASAVGRALAAQMPLLQKVAGLLLVVLGLHLLGVLRLPFLMRTYQPGLGGARTAGYLTSFVTGMLLFMGWVPCVGPVLMTILVLAGGSETVGQGMLLLAVYSAGLAVPFLLVAGFTGYLVPWLHRFRGGARVVETISGLLVLAVGLAIFFDLMVVLSRYGSMLGLGWG